MLDRRGYYPRDTVHTDLVLLAMLSKAIKVSDAVCHLVEGDFDEEAFGLTRTLIDLAFNLRYIVNKDTADRAKLYFNFYSRNSVQMAELAAEYYPGTPLPANFEKTQNLAKSYKSPHQWAGSGMTAKIIALEPDTEELDDKGEPSSGTTSYSNGLLILSTQP